PLMAKTFHVDIVTPEAVIWSGEADMVSARTTEGDIGVLADHEPTMAALATGAVMIHHDGKVTVNAKIFEKRYGDVNILKDRKFPIISKAAGIMAFWTHEERSKFYKETWTQQQLYGQDEPWRAIKVEFK
ncbi:hypothetical protein LCGC14_2809980, partial [marine sediment metagenome]